MGEKRDVAMLSPGSTAPPPQAHSLQHSNAPAFGAQRCARSSRTDAARASGPAVRQDAPATEFSTRAAFVAQAWTYFDDAGYTESTIPGVASIALRVLRKCRCLLCGTVVAAAPTLMATHIVEACPIADNAAKQAMRLGRVDRFQPTAHRSASDARKQPQRPQCSTTIEAATTATAPAFASPLPLSLSTRSRTQQSSRNAAVALRTVDYVGAFMSEAAAIRVQQPRPATQATANAIDSPSLEEAGRRAEAWLLGRIERYEARIAQQQENEQPPQRGSCAAATMDKRPSVHSSSSNNNNNVADPTVESDKENAAPHEQHNNNKSVANTNKDDACTSESATKRRRLGGNDVDATPSRRRPTDRKKRLFTDPPAAVAAIQAPVVQCCDVQTLVRSVVRACVMENVPLTFVSSAAFADTLTRCCNIPLSADLLALTATALDTLAAPVDAAISAMRRSTAPLTLVVKRSAPHESHRAVVYLVDATTNRSALVSHQNPLTSTQNDDATAIWLHEVQQHYAWVANYCKQPLHVCVVDYPQPLQHALFAAIAATATPQTPFARLISGCMLHEWTTGLRVAALVLLPPDALAVVQHCTELALLINEVANAAAADAATSPSSVHLLERFVVLLPFENQVLRYALVLQQVLQRIAHLITTFGASTDAAIDTMDPGMRCRIRELLVQIGRQKCVASETLALLLPLAVTELLSIRTLSSTPSASQSTVRLTSGVFVCLELWLFASLAQATLRRTADAGSGNGNVWRAQFVQRQRVTRMRHQLACLLLDPRFAGVGLSAAGLQAAQQCVVKTALRVRPQTDVAALTEQLAAYVDTRGVFADRARWQRHATADPMAFWRSVPLASELQSVALLVCSIAPCSPPASDCIEAPPSSIPAADLDRITRIAQVRHHFRREEVVRDAAALTSNAAHELLAFLFAADDNSSNASSNALLSSRLAVPQLTWQSSRSASSAPASTSTASAIQRTSEAFAASMHAAIQAAVAQRSDDRLDATALTTCDVTTTSMMLSNFTDAWIDASDDGIEAMRRALASLSVVNVASF